MEEINNNEVQLEIQLDVFEGPLDLLLHLINQLEIDIYDIPIAKITSQYLTYLETMKINQIDLASEYFVMAASLMRIKSEMLVPRNENQVEIDEEDYPEEDPRKPLIDLLLEYKQIKEVVPEFERQHDGRSEFFGKEPTDLSEYCEKIELEDQGLEIDDLTRIFDEVLNRYEFNKPKQRTVDSEETTVPEKMEDIYNHLIKSKEKKLSFMDLLSSNSRQEIVLNFLALLELIKADQVSASQESLSGNIVVLLKNTGQGG